MQEPLQLAWVPNTVYPDPNVNTTDGTTAGTVSTGTITSGIYAPGAISATQKTAGEAFSFSTSYLQGDAVPTSAAAVGAVGNFSSQTSYAAGSAGDLAGTVSTGGALTLTAGSWYYCYWTICLGNYGN